MVVFTILGEFNFPGINWRNTDKSEKLPKHFEDNLLSQMFSEPTRKDAFLDLLFETTGLLGDVNVGGYLGHSNHEIAV